MDLIEVPSCLQTLKQTLAHSKQTNVLVHVIPNHHLLNQIFNNDLWKQIFKYGDLEFNKGFSSSLNLIMLTLNS